MRYVRRFVTLALIASALALPSAVRAQQASVASAMGPVDLLRGDGADWAPLAGVKDLRSQDLIRTGTGGTARIQFDDGSLAVLASAGLLRVDEAGKREGRARVLLRLLGGQLRVTATRVYPAEGRFEVETPTAVVSVRGTEFIVTYDTETADTEVVCVSGSVEVLGVLGVLGRPVVVGAGMGTTVRKGTFPAAPAPVSPEKLAEMRQLEEGTVSFEDSLIASFTGADTAAVVNPPRVPRLERAQGRRQSLRTQPRIISKDAEIIDQSIQEFTLTPPGQTPPGNLGVIIQP
jgi:ferric-dicitrate binding protein FerR (iron transport regulator)